MHYYAGSQTPIEAEPEDTVHPPKPQTLTSPRNLQQHGATELEILKSIVYGGLIESITSLSVVTSAASAATATCKCSDFFFLFILLIWSSFTINGVERN